MLDRESVLVYAVECRWPKTGDIAKLGAARLLPFDGDRNLSAGGSLRGLLCNEVLVAKAADLSVVGLHRLVNTFLRRRLNVFAILKDRVYRPFRLFSLWLIYETYS